jgi:hypothetical protein
MPESVNTTAPTSEVRLRQFQELAVGDRFMTAAVPGERFRKDPGNLGVCMTDASKTQGFAECAPVTLIETAPAAPAKVAAPVAESSDIGQTSPQSGSAPAPAAQETSVAPANTEI